MKTAYFTDTEHLKTQVYNEFLKGTAIVKIKKQFSISAERINEICTEIYTNKKHLIHQVKHDHPPTENVNVLELGNIMCASFTHLTVGDCIVEDGKIVNFKNLYEL